MGFFFTILTLAIALGIAWRYLGAYMAAVFDGRVRFLAVIERPIYRLLRRGSIAGAAVKAFLDVLDVEGIG